MLPRGFIPLGSEGFFEVEIGYGGVAFKHKEGAIPPTSTHVDSPGKDACDGL
jgi:hypothetical protein